MLDVRKAPAVLVLVMLFTPAAVAQRRISITGDRLSGVVLPIEPLTGDIELRALRGAAWVVDDTNRLWLDGDVVVSIAGWQFTSQAATVWINRLPSADGLINQIAVYFERVDNPKRSAGIGVAGNDLLITGSARGGVNLQVSLLEDAPPRRAPVIDAGEERLAAHIRRLLGEPQDLEVRPQVDRPPAPDAFTPVPGGRMKPKDLALPEEVVLPVNQQALPWLQKPEAKLGFSYGSLKITPGDTENTIVITDSVVLEYFAPERNDELGQFTLAADSAVIFTDPGPLEDMATWQLDAEHVRGIYLEGNVSALANDGDYILRAPRVYYDFGRDQAIMLESVLRTYDRETQVPVYARAEEMRQIASNQWRGRDVRVTTSEFHTGTLTLGARQMTVTQRPARTEGETAGGSGDRKTHIDARDVTLRAGNAPFFYWPRFSGTARDIPLRSIGVGTSDNDGVGIETAWDLFTLLGIERPNGLDAELSIDGFTKRGAGLGLDLDYGVLSTVGNLDLYGMHDTGTDRTSAGEDVDPNHEFRGVALWEQQTRFSEWVLQTQASYISDETFITSWREDDFAERREYENSVYLKRQKDRAALTFLGKYEESNMVSSNDYVLASTQYQTDKLPEIGYHRFGDSWFGNTMTYSGQASVSRMRLVFEENSTEELGVRRGAFGLPPDEPVADALRAAGLDQQFVNRFDSRHELSRPFQWGIFDITPFVAGRVTAYDSDFDEYSPDETDKGRFFGATGVRLGTFFQRVDDGVESRLFDLHRLRHLIEPSVTLWYGAANIDEEDLPVYDLDVESLGTAAALRVGVRNTLETQRGGPGRWHSVDFLTLDTNVVLNSNDANKESPTPQFFDYRPELSQFGDHLRTTLVWLPSDTFAVTGDSTYAFDESVLARGSIGFEMRHNPLLTTYVEFRYIEASDSELLGLGWLYKLSRKYEVAVNPQWDFNEDKFRSVNVRVTRLFPDFELAVQVRYDDIRDDTSVGASIGLVEF